MRAAIDVISSHGAAVGHPGKRYAVLRRGSRPTDSLTAEAVPANEMFAEAVPLACGVKVIVKEAVWPAGIVTGNESPPSRNSELLPEADDTVTLDPLAVNVAVSC